MTENEFKALCQEKGYGDVKVKDFEPHLYDPAHTHERSIMGLVVSGTMTLEWENGANTYGVGDICDLCPLDWDPDNRPYIDGNNKLWPKAGRVCNGEFSVDNKCTDDEDDMGTTGGEEEGEEDEG